LAIAAEEASGSAIGTSVFFGEVSVTDGVLASAARVRFDIGNTIDIIENWQIKQKGNIDQNYPSIPIMMPSNQTFASQQLLHQAAPIEVLGSTGNQQTSTVTQRSAATATNNRQPLRSTKMRHIQNCAQRKPNEKTATNNNTNIP
jgi:hypothetical protein